MKIKERKICEKIIKMIKKIKIFQYILFIVNVYVKF